MNLPPKEGVGNAGCPLHPRPRVHLVLVVLTVSFALPGDRACLPPSHADMSCLSPVGPT